MKEKEPSPAEGYRLFDPNADEHLLVPGTKIRWYDDAFNCFRKAEIVRKGNEWAYWVDEGRGEILINVIKIKEVTTMGSNRREAVMKATTLQEAASAARGEPTKPAVTADVVIAAYIKTRDAIEAEKKLFDEKVEKLKAVQLKREQWLTSKLDALKLTNFKASGVGIAFFKNRTSATIADATQFVAWVKEDWDGRNHFLEKRVSKTAVDESVKDGNTPPPGTSYSTTRVVQINRG